MWLTSLVRRTARGLLATTLLTAPAALAAQAPAPADLIGFEPGQDYKLADHSEIVGYFRALDDASDRVIVERIGRSTLDRPMIMALVSSRANLRSRERHRDIARRLALAKELNEDEARALAKEGKAVVWIDGGLHATEVAHAQHMPPLAHWLATSESDEARRIRENAIVLLMPVMNPDGLDIVVDWYERSLGTPFETAGLPELYQHYIGHDNNRDWYMFTQDETRAVARQLYHEWFPQIVYNHHQPSPFPGRIWIPPFEDPVNPNLDPLVVSSINAIGEAIRKRLDEEDKPGAVSGIVYDLWWNGSMRGGPDYHNMLGFLTETAATRYATPVCTDPEDLPDTFGSGLPAKTPSTSYNNPWPGGCWHLRDAVDYMLSASRAVADHAAKQKTELLYNIYRMGRRQIARGERAEGGPFAYVIDVEAQHDPGAAVEMLRVFRTANVEIRRAERPFRADGRAFPAGAYVIPPQAFRPFVVDLMEPKRYPERRLFPGGPPEPPYDMTGYELSFQMGVEPARIGQPFEMPGPAVDTIPAPAGGVTGTGSVLLASPAANASTTAMFRLLDAGAEVARATSAFDAAGARWPAGTWIVRGADRARADAVGRELGVRLRGVDTAPAAAVRSVRTPRVGLYRGGVASMAEGWTRWVLERYGVPYERVTDATIRAGDLEDYDIIVMPSQDTDDILHGHRPGAMPPEYVGGLGVEGAAALKRFVEGGGWLLALDDAVDFAIGQFGLPVRNIAAGRETSELFVPGSMIRLRPDPSDPLAYGMAEDAIAFFARSQVLEVTAAASGAWAASDAAGAAGTAGESGSPDVYARYADDDFLASGWARGGDRYLAGRGAAVRVPLGRGQVVLIGFRPHLRGQPHNTFKLLFDPLFASTMEGLGDDARRVSAAARPGTSPPPAPPRSAAPRAVLPRSRRARRPR